VSLPKSVTALGSELSRTFLIMAIASIGM